MKREEAIKLLKQYQGYEPMSPDGETLKHAFDLTDETVDTLLTALRPVSREPLEKFKEYFDDLYGKGLEVYGWHMNGEAKSFDDFYEDACEYAGL